MPWIPIGTLIAGVPGPPSPGPPGPRGQDANSWLSGSSAPKATDGLPRDFYLQAGNVVWYKTPGFFGQPPTWTKVASLTGPQGKQGGVGDTGRPGKDGNIGLSGRDGIDGATGIQGMAAIAQRGQDGATWASGAGKPALSLGNLYDFYFQTDTGDIWRKTQPLWGAPPVWLKVANIVGPQGKQGPVGVGSPGPVGPPGLSITGQTGADGIQGVPGAAAVGLKGQDGATWLIGTSAPTAAQGNVGDLYFQTTTTGGGAILLKGDKGDQGPPGFPGTGGGSSSSATVVNSTCQGRLTLTTLTPVTTAEVTSATTIYFTPYKGNQIALYVSNNWTLLSFSEISIALGTLTSGKNYDVFCYSNAGVAALEFSTAWTSDTARNDAVVLQDGVLVKSTDHSRRYLGTFRTISTTATADFSGTATQVGGQRFLWNMYNRVSRSLSVIDTTSSWIYSTATYRQANGAAGNKVEYVCGQAEDAVQAMTLQGVDLTLNAVAYGGVGVDSTTVPSGLRGEGYNNIAAAGGDALDMNIMASYVGVPGLGYHYLAWMERGTGAGTNTWVGAAGEGTGGRQSGMTATTYG